MRQAGAVVAKVLSKLKLLARPGVTTAELDRVAMELTAEACAEPLFKGVRNPQASRPFPAAICASVNEQVVHGIPSSRTVLKEGDILSIDFGIRLKGYCADAAVTVPIGQVAEDRRRLIEVTEAVLALAIAQARPGIRWSHVAGQMQRYAEAEGFSVVKDFVGHGIGRQMHEEPRVPNFVGVDGPADDFTLAEGMTLAVEPMINAGTDAVRILANGWTVVTKDGKCSAHFEHTIAITKTGCEVLTDWSGQAEE